MKMTTEEAFVKTLQMHGIRHAFGIIGSAMMPISDIFPKAGIMFWDCAHEGSAGMMADGYTRATGEMSMMIAQNGPGITNFVTAVKTAYWNHTPLLLVTPQAANKTIGQGGFQEVEQMKLFEDMVAYQEEVRDPSRVAEVLNRVIMQAHRASAPAQINMQVDFVKARFTEEGLPHSSIVHSHGSSEIDLMAGIKGFAKNYLIGSMTSKLTRVKGKLATPKSTAEKITISKSGFSV